MHLSRMAQMFCRSLIPQIGDFMRFAWFCFVFFLCAFLFPASARWEIGVFHTGIFFKLRTTRSESQHICISNEQWNPDFSNELGEQKLVIKSVGSGEGSNKVPVGKSVMVIQDIF